MAQLYYRYSTMNAGKSIDVLKTYHNYMEQGKAAVLFTSALENRFGTGVVASRIGLQEKAILFDGGTDFHALVAYMLDQGLHINCVLVDEAQFLTAAQVSQLTDIVDECGIPVIAYGLKTDSRSQLFEGSAALLCEADKLEELKTVCWFCDRKATKNMRVDDGRPVFDGPQIAIGDNANKASTASVAYFPVCRRCYKAMKRSSVLPDIPDPDVPKLKRQLDEAIGRLYTSYQAERGQESHG
ncbi:thymidine kinase [Paenibacillus sp. J31TS4]|nr:thymidine kinase [Paenibacillus sp. J31TS4]GIP39425.1 thymidine kinase [Paenibacillus sp. J31TS4]